MRSSSQQPFNKEKYKLSHPQSPAQNQLQQNLHEQYPSLYETPTFKPIDKDNQTLRQITDLREQIKKLEDQNFELQKQLVQQEKINSENQYNKEIIIRELNSILNNFDQDFTTRIASQKSLSKDPWETQQSQNKLIMEMIFQLKANRRLHNINQTEVQDKPKISNYEQKQEQFPTTAQYLQQTNSSKLQSLQGQNTYLQDQVQALEGRIRGMANPRPQTEEAKDMFIATFGQELQQQQQDYESQKYSYYGSRYLNQQKEELRENPYDHKYYK